MVAPASYQEQSNPIESGHFVCYGAATRVEKPTFEEPPLFYRRKYGVR